MQNWYTTLVMKKYIAISFLFIFLPLFPVRESKADFLFNPQHPILHRQSIYLSLLEWCESGGHTNLKILDSNNKYSYGGLMFQMDTFLTYGKKYKILSESTTVGEAEKKIYDIDIQREIAHRMLLDGLYGNWLHCTNSLQITYPID